ERPRHLGLHLRGGRIVAPRIARRRTRFQRHDAELSRCAGEPSARCYATERGGGYGGGEVMVRTSGCAAAISAVLAAAPACSHENASAAPADRGAAAAVNEHPSVA